MKKGITLVLMIGLLALTALFVGAEDSADLQKCPDFTLKNLQEDNVDFNSFLGKGPIFLDFWATWCKPCKKEMVELQKLYDKYEEQGFTVVAISLDDAKSETEVKKFIKKHKYNFPVLLDPTQEVAKKLGWPGAMPYSLLIDSEGQIHHKHLGYNEGDEKAFEKEILALLGTDEKTESGEATGE